MKISFGGHDFLLDPSGVVFWPEESLLIASDLHLEKGSHFARRGFFLPPYDSLETLQKLHMAIHKFSPRRILLLGDCFHDAKAHERLPQTELELFTRLLAYGPIWIKGNHDGDYVPPGFEAHETYTQKGISFSHMATRIHQHEISGHFHPKVEISHKQAIISRPCFIEDGIKLILPAFGTYTGGLSVNSPDLSSIFLKDVRTYALGNKVYRV